MLGFDHQPTDWSRYETWTNNDGTTFQALEFIINGQPIQKGNIVKSRYGKYHDKTVGIDKWMEMAKTCAMVAMSNRHARRMHPATPEMYPRLTPFDGPILMDITLVRQRLKKHGKDSAGPHISTPDADKLGRSIGDALTGIVYSDDCQTVEMRVRKRWAEPDERPGAHVIVVSGFVVGHDEKTRWSRLMRELR